MSSQKLVKGRKESDGEREQWGHKGCVSVLECVKSVLFILIKSFEKE